MPVPRSPARPPTRSATEAGCDEDQVGPGHHPADLLGILFGSLPPDGGVAAGPETLRQLRADLDAPLASESSSTWASVLTAM